MAREKRKISNIGLYHVLIRGKNNLFIDNKDYEQFLILLQKYFYEQHGLIAYCLLEKSVHLIIYEESDNVCRLVKPMCTSYARYFNKKYNKEGKIFYDRYQSECIENNYDLLKNIKFLHERPKLDGINDWNFTSENEYCLKSGICNIQSLFDRVGGELEYIKVANSEDFFMCLDDYGRMNNSQIAKYIEFLCGVDVKSIKLLPLDKKEECIRIIKKDSWISNRRISEIVCIDRNFIDKVDKADAKIELEIEKELNNVQPKRELDVWLL